MKQFKFYFGVFTKGKCCFRIGKTITCTHNTAQLIVSILDLAKDSLPPNYYFAAELVESKPLQNKPLD